MVERPLANGHNVSLLAVLNDGDPTPDMTVDGRLAEIKTSTGANAAAFAQRVAVVQAEQGPQFVFVNATRTRVERHLLERHLQESSGGGEVAKYDVICIAESDVASLRAAIRANLRAVPESDLYGEKFHLRAPNGGRLYTRELVGSGTTTVGLASDFDEAHHNAWAIEVFDSLALVMRGGAELIDEADNVVRRAHRASV